jgi:chitin disaccharide deacetylase
MGRREVGNDLVSKTMNPALKRLGYDERDRVVIVHADDVGMCQATLPALARLLEAGLVSSAATMVPCPWFPEVAAFCRGNPGVDVGVHLTLTCEYNSYRWGPISTRDRASGLVDKEGYFHPGPLELQAHAEPGAVAAELAAQVDCAFAAGIEVTHLDTHQAAVLSRELLSSYTGLAVERRLPLMLLRQDADGWRALGRAMGLPIDPETAKLLAEAVLGLEARGVPLVDHAFMLPLDQPQDRVELAKRAFRQLPPGLTHFVLHPAVDSPELRAITPDWPSRVADFQAFSSDELCDFVRGSGVQILGYRGLRDLS